VLVDESGHPWTWRVAYPLTGSQFLAAGNFLADVHLPDYGLDISDCQGGGDCYSFANFGDSAWNKFAGGPLASNCQGFVQAVMDQSGLNADGHPVSIYPPDPTYSPGLDPVDVYEALTKGYVGISSAVVEKNPQPLDYSGADVEPPDACSVYNLESAALEDPEALAASLGLSYHKQEGPTLTLAAKVAASGTPGPPYQGGWVLVDNDPAEDTASTYSGQYADFSEWGDSTSSLGNSHGPAYECGKVQNGSPTYCAGHLYASAGPFHVRQFLFGYGNALDEYDSTWEYDSNNTTTWKPDYVPPSGGSQFCSAPASESERLGAALYGPNQPAKQLSGQSSSYIACQQPTLQASATPLLMYYPTPHRSLQYFTLTIAPDPRHLPYMLNMSAVGNLLSVENPISTYLAGSRTTPASGNGVTLTSPQLRCQLQREFWDLSGASETIQCRSSTLVTILGESIFEKSPIKLDTGKNCGSISRSGCVVIALTTRSPDSRQVFTVRSDSSTARPRDIKVPANYSLSSKDCNAAWAARRGALIKALALLEKFNNMAELLAHLRDAAGIADAVGILEAIAELVWEIAKGAVVGVVTVVAVEHQIKYLLGLPKGCGPASAHGFWDK